MSGVEFGKMQDYIKKLKYEFIIDNAFVLSTTSCFSNDSSLLFSTEVIESKLTMIANHFDINETVPSDHTISNETIEAAGDMFIYLYLCPKFNWRWTNFYVDLFQNSTPDVIVQTLNRIMYTAGRIKENKSNFNLTKKVFLKVLDSFNLLIPYNKLSKGYLTNNATGKVKLLKVVIFFDT